MYPHRSIATRNTVACVLAAITGADIVETSALAYSPSGHSDFIGTWQGAADVCRVIANMPQLPKSNGRSPIAGFTNVSWLDLDPATSDDCTTNGKAAHRLLVQLNRSGARK